MIQRIPFDITSPYITEPLEVETFSKACKDNHISVLNRLYHISNNKKEYNVVLELVDHPTLIGKISVSMECAYVGKAKNQASIVRDMKKYINRSPKYTVRCRIHTVKGAKEIFTFKHVTSSQDKVYSLIVQLEEMITKKYIDNNE